MYYYIEMTKIDLRDISFNSYLTDGELFEQVGKHLADEAYSVSMEAFKYELPRRHEEDIDFMMGGRKMFPERLANPEVSIEDGRLFPDQSFSDPCLTVAIHKPGTSKSEIVGVGFSVNNVSGGSEIERSIKLASRILNYRCLKNFAVLPDFQSRGIGTTMAAIQLAKARRLQPASAYAWPNEGNAAGSKFIESIGMQYSGTAYKDVFGLGKEHAVLQNRFEAKNALKLLERLVSLGVPKKLLLGETLGDLRRVEKDSLDALSRNR